MLTSLHIENFKAWKDTGKIRLAPLTVIFGANSTGKSSIGHLLLALKQTVLSADRKQVLHLGDANSPIELGTYKDCIYNHDLSNNLHFQLSWNLPDNLDILDPITNLKFSGSELALDVLLGADKNSQPKIRQLNYVLSNVKSEVLSVNLSEKHDSLYELSSEEYHFKKKTGKDWAVDKPDKFYRISNHSRALYQNADFLDDFALQTEAVFNGLYFLGPIREYPKHIYSWSGEKPESVGSKGENTIAAILSAIREGWEYRLWNEAQAAHFGSLIQYWLERIGLTNGLAVHSIAKDRNEYEVLVRTHENGPPVKITDVGFGVSQVLPVIVQAFYAPPNSTVWIEQPELHLHPQVQAELADLFISAIKTDQNNKPLNAQLIVESHSEHFLYRLQRRIAEGEVKPDDVAIYFCKRVGTETELEALRVNDFGEIENWPENFFGDEMADIAARTTAAMKRKMAGA
ncbi:MAG: DUF3696 domain-containing protein [Methylomonas sp.]|jgi:predicted ATPase